MKPGLHEHILEEQLTYEVLVSAPYKQSVSTVQEAPFNPT
jgi:hypothetical protein